MLCNENVERKPLARCHRCAFPFPAATAMAANIFIMPELSVELHLAVTFPHIKSCKYCYNTELSVLKADFELDYLH